MAKAYKAPKSNYERKFIITTHAIDRIRDRMVAHDVKFSHQGDPEVGNWLDEQVDNAMRLNRYHDILDEGRPSRAVTLEDLPGDQTLIAVLRKGEDGRPDVVVTILTEAMAATRGDAWEMSLQSPFSELEKLKAKVPKKKPAAAPEAVPEPVEPEKATKIFTYAITINGKIQERLNGTGELRDVLEALILSCPGDTIEVWRTVPFSMRIDLDV